MSSRRSLRSFRVPETRKLFSSGSYAVCTNLWMQTFGKPLSDSKVAGSKETNQVSSGKASAWQFPIHFNLLSPLNISRMIEKFDGRYAGTIFEIGTRWDKTVFLANFMVWIGEILKSWCSFRFWFSCHDPYFILKIHS